MAPYCRVHIPEENPEKCGQLVAENVSTIAQPPRTASTREWEEPESVRQIMYAAEGRLGKNELLTHSGPSEP